MSLMSGRCCRRCCRGDVVDVSTRAESSWMRQLWSRLQKIGHMTDALPLASDWPAYDFGLVCLQVHLKPSLLIIAATALILLVAVGFVTSVLCLTDTVVLLGPM